MTVLLKHDAYNNYMVVTCTIMALINYENKNNEKDNDGNSYHYSSSTNKVGGVSQPTPITE
jgi:hypothetical protein